MRCARGCALALVSRWVSARLVARSLIPCRSRVGVLVGLAARQQRLRRHLPRLDLGDETGQRRVPGRVLDAHQDRPEVPVDGRALLGLVLELLLGLARAPSHPARVSQRRSRAVTPRPGSPFAQTGMPRWRPRPPDQRKEEQPCR